MDHRYIEDNNLIERYVLGRLPVEEQIRFEAHFADCDACVAELELADDFGTALRSAAINDAARVVEAGLLASLVRRLSGPLGFAALGLLIAAIVLPAGWMISQNQRLRDDLSRLRQPQTHSPSVLLTVARDAAAPPSLVSVPKGASWWTLAIETDDEVASYQATITQSTGDFQWRAGGLEPNLWNVLQLTFPREFLPPGDYRLEVEIETPDDGLQPFGIYNFRLTSP